MIKQTLDLNLIPGRVLPRVNVSQYDKGTRTLEFTIYNGDILFDPTGYTAYIQGQKPDGHGFNYAADIEDQKISVDVVEQMTAVSGSVVCEIVIKYGTDQIGTGNFILQVEAAALPDDATMSESDYNVIQQAVEDAQAAAEEAKEATANAPYIGENGNWYVYDAESQQYIDTGVEAEGPEGPEGPTGNGIASITKTGTVGLVDTYTITFTDGTTTTFTVTNGEDAVTTVEQGDSLALAPTSAGNALPLTIYGQSTQNGTPTPSAPIAIESATADFKCVGKNLHDISRGLPRNNVSTTTAVYDGDGLFTINGTASAAAGQIIAETNGYKISGLKNGDKLVLSYEVVSGSASNLGTDSKSSVFVFKTGGNFPIYFPASLSKGDKGSREITITDSLLTDGYFIYNGIQIWMQKDAVFNNLQLRVMLRLYDTTDVFEPYKHTDITTYQTLRSIEVTSSDHYNLVKDGKYYIADTIDWDEVDGYTLTKRIGEVTLTSAEDITVSSGNDSPTSKCYRWQKAVFVNDVPTTRLVPIYSNRFVDGVTADGVKALGKCLGRTPARYKNLQVYVSLDTSITTPQDAGDWLDANETKVQYILDVPVKTSLTSAQAKALLSMRTYDESTSIDAVNAPAPVLELEYAKTRTPALALTGHNMAHINAIDIGDM